MADETTRTRAGSAAIGGPGAAASAPEGFDALALWGVYLHALSTVRAIVRHEMSSAPNVLGLKVHLVSEVAGLPGMPEGSAERLSRYALEMAKLLRDVEEVHRGMIELLHVDDRAPSAGPADLVETLGEIRRVLELYARSESRMTTFAVPEAPLPVAASAIVLRQSLFALFVSAIRTLPERGRIEVELRREGPEAVLSIREWRPEAGSGIEGESADGGRRSGSLDDRERRVIHQALAECGGRVASDAAATNSLEIHWTLTGSTR